MTMRSNAWLNGRKDSASSSSVTCTRVPTSVRLATMAPCVSITPFGSPVVPEV